MLEQADLLQWLRLFPWSLGFEEIEGSSQPREGDSVKDAGFGCDAERERSKSPTGLCGEMGIPSSTRTNCRSSLWLLIRRLFIFHTFKIRFCTETLTCIWGRTSNRAKKHDVNCQSFSYSVGRLMSGACVPKVPIILHWRNLYSCPVHFQ